MKISKKCKKISSQNSSLEYVKFSLSGSEQGMCSVLCDKETEKMLINLINVEKAECGIGVGAGGRLKLPVQGGFLRCSPLQKHLQQICKREIVVSQTSHAMYCGPGVGPQNQFSIILGSRLTNSKSRLIISIKGRKP